MLRTVSVVANAVLGEAAVGNALLCSAEVGNEVVGDAAVDITVACSELPCVVLSVTIGWLVLSWSVGNDLDAVVTLGGPAISTKQKDSNMQFNKC